MTTEKELKDDRNLYEVPSAMGTELHPSLPSLQTVMVTRVSTVKSIPQRKPWKERLAVLQNLRFFLVFLIPAFLIWLPFMKKHVTIGNTGNVTTYEFKRNAEKFEDDRTFSGLFVLLVVGCYWAIGCMPIAGAAIMPLILVPMLTTVDAKSLLNEYMKNANMMAFSCIILSLCGKHSGFTKRIALKLLSMSGGDFRKCSFLAVVISALFSMWFANAGVMMFMMDVVEKIIAELKDSISLGSLGDHQMEKLKIAQDNNDQTALEGTEKINAVASENLEDETKKAEANETKPAESPSSDPIGQSSSMMPMSSKMSQEPTVLTKSTVDEENDYLLDTYRMSLLHSIAVVTNIGGLLWGHCSVNGILLLTGTDRRMDAGLWMSFTFPILVIILPITIWYLDYFVFVFPYNCLKKGKSNKTPGKKTFLDLEKQATTNENLQAKFSEGYDSQGSISPHEFGVICLFVGVAFMFIISDPVFFKGWGSQIGQNVQVSTIAMLAAGLAFLIPKNVVEFFRPPKKTSEKPSFASLLGWKLVQGDFPWGLLIYIGAGAALGLASNKSQFTDHMANQMVNLSKNMPKEVVLLVAMLWSFFWACFASNSASAVIAVDMFLKSQVIQTSSMGPFGCYYVVPCVAVASLGFILPAGTPTTALVQMRTRKLNSERCLHLGFPIAVIFFIVIYIFAIFYTKPLIPCIPLG